MAIPSIAFTAVNYRDYHDYWLKAYTPGTTTPLPAGMALDKEGTVSVAKLQLNADGFIISAGNALVMPFIAGFYDLWLFPTEADADLNDTSNAIRVADNLNAFVGDTTEIIVTTDALPDVATMKATESLIAGTTVSTISYYESWDVLKRPVGGARYSIVTLQEVRDALVDPSWLPDEFGSHTLNNGLIAWLLIDLVADVTQYGAKNDQTDDASPAIQAAASDRRYVSHKFYIPDGVYNWGTTVDVAGNTEVEFSQGALLKPIADNFIMLQHVNLTASGSNVKISNMFASDFNGTSVGVTMIFLERLGVGVELHSIKATQLDTMLEIGRDSFGAKIYSPSAFRVPFPVKTGTTGSVGTVDIYSPNFDNSTDQAGGTGFGIGIDFAASGSVYGGYIQGFNTCVKIGGRGTIDATYFESVRDNAILCDGAFGVTIKNPFFFGFNAFGGYFITSVNSEMVKIINPVVVKRDAIGTYNFDNTNRGCTYEQITNKDITRNTILGITTGITDVSLSNNFRSIKSIDMQDVTVGVAIPIVDIIDISFPSSVKVKVSVETVEQDGLFAAIVSEHIFAVRRGVTMAISPVTITAEANTNTASFALANVVTAAEIVTINNDAFQVSVQVDTTGATTLSLVDIRVTVEICASGTDITMYES